jgi:hypothetical protein
MLMTATTRLPGAIAAGLVLFAAAPPATAQPAAETRAAYVDAAQLEAEGPAHVLDVAVLGQYARAADPGDDGGVSDVAGLALRNRLLIGRRAGFCVGLDAEVGGSDEGVQYGATGYIAGAGARWGDAGAIALCGGAGLDGVAGAIPVAARFPVELSLSLDAGPLRAVPWARAAWVAGASARQDGVSWTSAVDEVEAGLLVRFARQRRYWSSASAGGGLALGVVHRELMGTSWTGLVVGLGLTGAQ